MFSSCACCSKQTSATTWLVVTACLFLLVNVSQSRICTRMTAEKHFKVEKIKTTCVQTFEAKCGWFSLSTCTYNETVDCIKEENRTTTIYRIAEDCCPGYSRSLEGKCIRDSRAHSSLDDGRRDDGKIYLGLSHGAYAGIVCGVLFVACITLLTVMHYHKRKKRQKKSDSAMSQLNAAQTQQMLSMAKLDSSVDT
ncbi:uncharacterized protein LOC112561109 isoform X2 [Pomacea canaliculata]|uniref:uncharacterized protein LOC112561109 isoform X2 n=1 Tax=Pomacea canaliculata TaxID=400727 RepID=UPI000D725273|nr:uncharacterized protein LOC112561109 isoform X2 [Pomacea canaliculata]